MKIPWFDAEGNIIPDTNTRSHGNLIAPDLPEFVSPIDGKTYSGRRGMREHCAKHDVVPTADLKGLPNSPSANSPRSRELRDAIQRQMANKGLL